MVALDAEDYMDHVMWSLVLSAALLVAVVYLFAGTAGALMTTSLCFGLLCVGLAFLGDASAETFLMHAAIFALMVSALLQLFVSNELAIACSSIMVACLVWATQVFNSNEEEHARKKKEE
jgi:predicted membrane protein